MLRVRMPSLAIYNLESITKSYMYARFPIPYLFPFPVEGVQRADSVYDVRSKSVSTNTFPTAQNFCPHPVYPLFRLPYLTVLAVSYL